MAEEKQADLLVKLNPPAAPWTLTTLPPTGFIRLPQIIGDPKADPPIPALIPVSASTWWAGVKSGRFPKPVKLSERCTAWRVEDMRDLIEQTGKGV